jgi:hypothetical protein
MHHLIQGACEDEIYASMFIFEHRIRPRMRVIVRFLMNTHNTSPLKYVKDFTKLSIRFSHSLHSAQQRAL